MARQRSALTPAFSACAPLFLLSVAAQLNEFSMPRSGKRNAYAGLAALVTPPKVALGTRFSGLMLGLNCGILTPVAARVRVASSSRLKGGPASVHRWYPICACRMKLGLTMCVIAA